MRYVEDQSPNVNDAIAILSYDTNIEIEASEDIDFTTEATLSSDLMNISAFNDGSGTTSLTIGGNLRVSKFGGVGNVLTQSAGGRHRVSLLPGAALHGGGYGVAQVHGVDVAGEAIETVAGGTAGGETIARIDGVVRLDDGGAASGPLNTGEKDATAGRAWFIATGGETAAVTITGAGTLVGNQSGLAVHHRGKGDISVDFSGEISARYGDAIDITAENPAVRTNLAFSGVIQGGRDGIALDSSGEATIAIGGDLTGRRYALRDGGGNTTVYIGKPDNGVDKIHVAGDIALGDGDDVLAFDDSVAFDGVAVFDGGAGEDRLDIGTHLTGSTSSAGSPSGEQIQIKNWETVDIASAGGLTLTGDLDAADIDNAGLLDLSPETPSARLAGNLTNRGEIRLDGNPSSGQRLVVRGDYHGRGGKVWVNTVWNAPRDAHGADSRSDVLEIVGDADGRTEVVAITKDGRENTIDGDVGQIERMLATVPVVTVAGDSAADAFSGRARTTGATEAQLIRTVGPNGATSYHWTMRAKEKQADSSLSSPTRTAKQTAAMKVPVAAEPSVIIPVSAKSSVTTPVSTQFSDSAATGAVIYAPPVSGYVQMAAVNGELLQSMLGGVVDRLRASPREHAWGQVAASHLDLDGEKRFASRGDRTLLMIGKDFGLSAGSSYRNAGIYFSYGRANTRFSDDKRAVDGVISGDKRTGSGTTHAAGFGGYATIQGEDSAYLDMGYALSYLTNRFAARAAATVRQKGYGAALSAQVGRVYPRPYDRSTWAFEPQARVSYRILRLDDFHDGMREVKFPLDQSLVTRLGVRLSHRGTNNVSLGIGLAHEFLEAKAVAIGADRVRESYADTWGEVGVAMRLPLSRRGYLHADVAYERGFGAAPAREGYRGMAGFTYFLD